MYACKKRRSFLIDFINAANGVFSGLKSYAQSFARFSCTAFLHYEFLLFPI